MHSLPYPPNLHALPTFPTPAWLDTQIGEARQNGELVSQDEEELALGCDWHVSALADLFLNLKAPY